MPRICKIDQNINFIISLRTNRELASEFFLPMDHKLYLINDLRPLNNPFLSCDVLPEPARPTVWETSLRINDAFQVRLPANSSLIFFFKRQAFTYSISDEQMDGFSSVLASQSTLISLGINFLFYYG